LRSCLVGMLATWSLRARDCSRYACTKLLVMAVSHWCHCREEVPELALGSARAAPEGFRGLSAQCRRSVYTRRSEMASMPCEKRVSVSPTSANPPASSEQGPQVAPASGQRFGLRQNAESCLTSRSSPRCVRAKCRLRSPVVHALHEQLSVRGDIFSPVL